MHYHKVACENLVGRTSIGLKLFKLSSFEINEKLEHLVNQPIDSSIVHPSQNCNPYAHFYFCLTSLSRIF